MNKNVILISLLLITVLISGCTEVVEEGPETTGEVMKVARNFWPGQYWVDIADKKGWFSQAGLNVELVDINDNFLPSVQDWVNGKMDVNQPVFFDFIKHNAQGADLVAVIVTDLSFDGDGIIAKKEIEGMKNLMGKRIGLEQGTFMEFILSTVLERNGMTLVDVVLVENQAEEIQPFIDGKLDAIVTWDPYLSEAINKGDGHRIFGTSEIPGLVSDVMGFHRSFIEERPGDVQAFVNVWHKTTEFIKENPGEALEIIAEIYDIPFEDVAAFAEGDKILDLRDNKVAFSYAAGFESLHGTAKQINDFMKNNGITDMTLDSIEFIDGQFIREVQD